MTDDDIFKYEIRVILIGDYDVGKKSIANRFKLLNSTSTVEDTYFIQKALNEQTKSKKSTSKPQKPLSFEAQLIKRLEQKRQSIMSTSKIFEINKIRLTFFFLPITEALEIENDQEMKEEDEDNQEYKLNLNPTLKEIEDILLKEPKNDKSEVIHLFLFCFDLQQYSTFQKIKIYYAEIEKTFAISGKYKVALIGNKKDQKKIMLPVSDIQLDAMSPKNEGSKDEIEELEKEVKNLKQLDKRTDEEEAKLYRLEERISDFKSLSPQIKKQQEFVEMLKEQKEQNEYLKSFISQKGLKYYEISTVLSFNFEVFFESLIKDILSEGYPELQKSTFTDKLHMFLKVKPSFSKQKRETFIFNDFPGPSNYSPNVFAYAETKAEFLKSFDNNKGRFKNKIFINKQGPMFPIINKEKELLHSKQEADVKMNNDRKSSTTFDWDNKNKKQIKEALEMNIPGYSFGTKIGLYNFKKERRDMKLSINNILSNAFEESDLKLHIKRHSAIKTDSDFKKYKDAREENTRQRINDITKTEGELRERHIMQIEKQEKERNEKIQKILEKEEKYNEIYKEKEAERSHSQQQSKGRTTKALFPIPTTPGPNAYNLPTYLNVNKGFTFGSKYYPNLEKLKNQPEPQYPTLPTDFDVIIKKNKHFNEIKRKFGDRFIPIKTIQPGDPQRIIDKLKKWEENRKNSQKSSNIKSFLDERKRITERVILEKERHEQEAQEEKEKQIQRQYEKNKEKDKNQTNYLLREINYIQVEEQSPQFSIKGRYEKGGMFHNGSNVGDINGLNSNVGGQMSSNMTQSSFPEPKFHIGKPKLPSFSFGKANRFNSITGNERETILFENGEFKPAESKSHLNKESYMGTGLKLSKVVDNGVPGPGFYRIKGFAEEVEEKGLQMDKVRKEIRDKEALKQKQNEEENENTKKGSKEIEYEKQDDEAYKDEECAGRFEDINNKDVAQAREKEKEKEK